MKQEPNEQELSRTAPVVIVGAGHSGVAVAAGLRARGWEGGILLLDAEKETPYERPPLSKELLKDGAPDESAVLRKEKFYQDKRIDRVAGIAADSIDRAGPDSPAVRRQPARLPPARHRHGFAGKGPDGAGRRPSRGAGAENTGRRPRAQAAPGPAAPGLPSSAPGTSAWK